MAARTVALTGVITDFASNPEANKQVTLAILAPNNAGTVTNTTDNSTVETAAKTFTLDGAGTLTASVQAPGDLSPAPCVYLLTLPSGGTKISPAFAYTGSTINVNTWTNAPSLVGTILMRAVLTDFTSTVVSGDSVIFSVSGQFTVVASGIVVPSSWRVQQKVDGQGNAAANCYLTSGMDTSRYYVAQFPDGSQKFFTAPDTPTGNQGNWSAVTTYHKNADTQASPSDVVLSGGVYYACVATNSLNSAPPSADWITWPGERITWHLVAGAPATGGIQTSEAMVNHSPLAATHYAAPTTLQQDLDEILYQIAILRMAGTHGRQTLDPLRVFI